MVMYEKATLLLNIDTVQKVNILTGGPHTTTTRRLYCGNLFLITVGICVCDTISINLYY